MIGARVRDEETDRSFDVTASRVIVCTGVWTDLVASLGGVQARYEVRMSKGVHLVMPRAAIDAETGMIVRTEKSVLFFIPWGERWIVGTTDTDWSGDRAEPTATGEDVDYILLAANRVLAKPLTRADVIGVYAGLRPLVAAAADTPTTKLSREHVVDVPVPGLATVAGGKFTTYRLMARDVVDAALADFPRPVAESVTAQLPLLGADGLPAVRAAAQRLAEDYDVPLTTVEHLLTRYGALVPEVLEPVGRDRSLARPLLEGYPYLRAEVAYAVTHEGALHVEDVLARRVRLLIESPDAGVPAAADVGVIMGGLLGWSRRRRALEVRRYLEFAESAAEALQSAADLPEPAELGPGPRVNRHRPLPPRPSCGYPAAARPRSARPPRQQHLSRLLPACGTAGQITRKILCPPARVGFLVDRLGRVVPGRLGCLDRYGGDLRAAGRGVSSQLVEGADAGALVSGSDAVLCQDGGDVAGSGADGGLVDAEDLAEQPVADAGAVVACGGGHGGVEREPDRPGWPAGHAAGGAAVQVQALLTGRLGGHGNGGEQGAEVADAGQRGERGQGRAWGRGRGLLCPGAAGAGAGAGPMV